MSTQSIEFNHGRAIRRLAIHVTEGAHYLVIGTKHLCVEGAKNSRRYVELPRFRGGLSTWVTSGLSLRDGGAEAAPRFRLDSDSRYGAPRSPMPLLLADRLAHPEISAPLDNAGDG
jgi:hypothetical protein